MTNENNTGQLVDHLFRYEYGKMVATLSRFLGLSHLDVVEDLVQETFAQALQSWKTTKPPDNPAAWLNTVAKRKAIDLIRKKKSDKNREFQVSLTGPATIQIEELFMDAEIPDSQLRMIFACCHPDLSQSDQIALTLKVVSGFGSKEIASALLTKTETIKKRIQRARNFLKSNNIALSIPSGNQLIKRLASVHLALYLLFNEGYASSHHVDHIRRDVCVEAMRLCRITVEHPVTRHPDNMALLALMCFHASRFDSRLNENGDMILLDRQDRSLWDSQLINIGRYHLHLATRQNGFSSPYHWEAAISAQHAAAKTFNDTNWTVILSCYKNLYALKPSEQIRLNQVIVLLQLKDLDKARHLYDCIEQGQCDATLYHSVGAEIAMASGNTRQAAQQLRRAYEATNSPSTRKLIQQKIDNLS